MAPYDEDFGTIEPEPPRERRRAWGPIAVGLSAFPLSYWVFGSSGILACAIAVGTWWAYKFRPRKSAPEAPGVRDFLRSAEEDARSSPLAPGEPPKPQAPAAWDDLKL